MRFLKLIVLLFLTLSETLVEAQVIKWQENRPLIWTDFKGKPDYGSGTVAVTYRKIIYDYKCEIRDSIYLVTFTLGCLFDSGSSWVLRKTMNNEYILGHEQLHFDIQELFTRKLASAFRSTVYTSNYKAEIRSIYDKYWGECGRMEATYDSETRHSNDRNMQYRWQLFIYEELKNLPKNY